VIASIVGPNLSFELITKDIEKMADDLETGGGIVATIYNDAQSKNGVYYWGIINNGRGAVRPVHAKALHWVDPKTGKDVFSMYSGPVAPRHIRENSIPAIQQALVSFPETATFNREAIIAFVNAIAEYAVSEMQSRTPVVTGLLRDSYRIEKAEG
jgi:hypothetical protein